ncbi:MAG: NAD(P)-binding domain-containing protein [Mycoplasmatales bacterium]|nr:NAD(P)-binding domain-containing protein [Mycoplasmatales bacterium]
MKIAIFDAKKFDKKTFNENNKTGHELVFFQDRITKESIMKAKGFDAVCGFVNCDGSDEILKKISEYGIKIWLERSAGYNNINLKSANKYGIKIWRVPAYSPEAVSEFALTLLMAINRNIHLSYSRTKDKNFSLEGLEGDTIYGQTIGIIGAGRIGQGLIRAAIGLGAKVIVFDEYAEKNFPDTAKKLGFNYVTKDEVFSQSDYLSLHAPLLPSTKHIVNKETLKLMKKNAIIINTARGALINTEDLIDALDIGQIRGAGLDVYEREEGIFFYDKSNELVPDITLTRLRAHRNVILSSHQAYFTNLALKQIAERTLLNADEAEAGDFSNSLSLQDDGTVING